MASVEREPITGFWGRSPQRGGGVEPLVRESRGKALPKLVTFFYSKCICCALILAFCMGAMAAWCTKFATLASK